MRCGAPGPHAAVAVQLGGVVCANCRPAGSPRLDPTSIELLRALLQGDWESAVASGERERGQAAGIAAAYTQWHLERGLRSFSVPRS